MSNHEYIQKYVALLRGINLGRRRVKMDHLRSLFEELRFSAVSTFIASGNVIFETGTEDERAIERQIERHLKNALGYEVETFIRTADEIESIADFQPFAAAEPEAPGNTLHVSFFREAIRKPVARKLLSCRTDVDDFCVKGRELYWLCRVRTTESTVWNSAAMKAISLPSSTMRNINTIRRLAVKLV